MTKKEPHLLDFKYLKFMLLMQELQVKYMDTIKGTPLFKQKIKSVFNDWHKKARRFNSEIRSSITIYSNENEFDNVSDLYCELFDEVMHYDNESSFEELIQCAKRIKLNEKNKIEK